MTRLAVVGLGLIGGSVALAARAREVASHVAGIDRRDVVNTAAARAAAHDLVDIGDERGVRDALQAADLVVFATPVGAIEAMIGELLEFTSVATDCGSTKRAIAKGAARSPRRSHFVPGHPMAGSPMGGIERARADLFEGQAWLLCPEQCDPTAVEVVEHLVRGLGATPRRISAEEHDRAVAVTSHVPQLLASVLAVLAESRGAGVAAGPAFHSATRVAGGGESMWRDILSTNADEVCSALDALGLELDTIARALRKQPPDLSPALHLLERARGVRSKH